jgi:hypothetical protein
MMEGDATMTEAKDQAEQQCYIEQFPHHLPHGEGAQMRPCGHVACNAHTITYYGTGADEDVREGDYCMVCYERALPGMCPDRVLREAIQALEAGAQDS